MKEQVVLSNSHCLLPLQGNIYLFCHHNFFVWNLFPVSSGQYGKKINVGKGGKLDIYIALDVSDSIEEDEFDRAKNVIKTLIDKVYEINSAFITTISTEWFHISA